MGAVVSNCVITGNQASDGWSGNCAGGGAYGGTLNNCTLTRNSASGHTTSFPSQVVGGGAALCILNNCTLTDNSVSLSIGYSNIGAGPSEADGGGAAFCTLNNCTLTRNSARASADDYFGSILPYSYGGGADDSALTNCTLTLNGAYYGGGAIGTLNNCTLTGNSAYSGGGALGTLNNCIVYFNSRDNYGSYSILNYCSTAAPRRTPVVSATSPTRRCSWTRADGPTCACNPIRPASMPARMRSHPLAPTWMAIRASRATPSISARMSFNRQLR